MAVALIALGSVLIAVAAATASSPSPRLPLRPNQTLLWTGVFVAGFGMLGLIGVAISALFRWQDDKQTPFVVAYDPERS